jgi:imidazolonepropionase-like amidohydrolase
MTAKGWISGCFGWGMALVAVAAGAAQGPGRPAPKLKAVEGADLQGARTVFERNLQAIRDKDRAAYLSCYLDSERLVRTGPDGSNLGYAGLAATAGQGWPDHIAAEDMKLTWIRAGLVYGTYRYRVRYGTGEVSGISERLFVATPTGWKIAISTAFPALPGVPPPPLALAGATLLDGNGGAPIADSVVVVREGRIECAGARAACPLPEQVDTLDLKGLWITPGLIDAHVHYSQTGWADGRPDALDVRARYPYDKTVADLAANPGRFGRSELCSGVTATFDVGGFSWTLDLPAKSEEDSTLPRIKAAGPVLATSGPPLNLPGERQILDVEDAGAAQAAVRYLKARGAAAVKFLYVVPRDRQATEYAALLRAAAEEAKGAGLPLVVHAQGLAEAKEALRAGARLLVHGVRDLPLDEDFLAEARRSGTIYCPTLTVSKGYLRMFESASSGGYPAVDDPNRCVDPGTIAKLVETGNLKTAMDEAGVRRLADRNAGWERVGAANLKRVADAGIPIAMGTDAGNPLTLHGPSVYAEMEAMQKAGLTPQQVLTAATQGGALALGREKELGTIEKGKLADLLVVAADPGADIANLRQLRYVVRGGILRSIAELSALATGVPAP